MDEVFVVRFESGEIAVFDTKEPAEICADCYTNVLEQGGTELRKAKIYSSFIEYLKGKRASVLRDYT